VSLAGANHGTQKLINRLRKGSFFWSRVDTVATVGYGLGSL